MLMKVYEPGQKGSHQPPNYVTWEQRRGIHLGRAKSFHPIYNICFLTKRFFIKYDKTQILHF